ncbi:ABC transporter permease [Clostridium pasteurianum]|uniref:ABC-type spermidine/putrescine transport system, permease component I n=1 Tax=Clostridium pasteurianum BC1 TaxID=86416 RepID=R4K9S6_CLOPA|nr:ABC transporter permease [Clostridium pasteurianum]AGK99323.1 ABC-type spermidine/putrescine transport system, permease component I [Clostridium pasteurianum BC1]
MKKNSKLKALLFVLPSFAVMLMVIIVPIINSAVLSLYNEKENKYDFSNYISILTDKNQINNIRYTLYIVIITVVLCISISLLLAIYLRFSKSKIAALIEKIYIIPKFIPGIVAVYALMLIIKDVGAINRFLLMFGIDFKPGLMFTPNGIIIVNLWFNIPFATMLILSDLTKISPSIIESARDVGANKLRILMEIILPLTYRSLLIAATFVFMGNIGEFTTPYLMGTNAPRMLGVALQQEFNVFTNYPRAAAMSVMMFILSAIVGLFYIYSMMKEDKWVS